MLMFHTCVLSSKLISLPPVQPITNATSLNSSTLRPFRCTSKRRENRSPAAASFSCPAIDVDYLKSEFSGHGVSFTEISDSCIVRMSLENGSVASLMLPSGLISSYKAPMWHGGLMELLHTTVSEGEDGGAVVQGGMSLDFSCQNDKGVSWSSNSWSLHEVKGTPQELIQIELISRNLEGLVEVRCIITLQQDLLSSELIISNLSSSSLHLMGSLISHLTVSTPEATYALGLQGSDYFHRPPVLTNFSIVPPDFGKRKNRDSMKSWGPLALLSKLGSRDRKSAYDRGSMLPEAEEDLKGEEEENYKHLTEEMSRIYTSAPRNFTIMDRGRRNSIIVEGDGFKELYMFSPGSSHKSYSKYSFVCIGHTALLEPICLHSQGKWRGQQQLCNPNL